MVWQNIDTLVFFLQKSQFKREISNESEESGRFVEVRSQLRSQRSPSTRSELCSEKSCRSTVRPVFGPTLAPSQFTKKKIVPCVLITVVKRETLSITNTGWQKLQNFRIMSWSPVGTQRWDPLRGSWFLLKPLIIQKALFDRLYESRPVPSASFWPIAGQKPTTSPVNVERRDF